MTMTKEKLAELKRLAKQATPGEWGFGSYAAGILITAEGRDKHYPIATMNGDWAIPWDSTEESKLAFNDASFIAAANPQTILSLIALAERALQPEEGQALPDGELSLDQLMKVFDMGLGFALCHRDFTDTRNAVKKLQEDFKVIQQRASQLALPAGPVGEVIGASDGAPSGNVAHLQSDMPVGTLLYASPPAVAQPVADEREDLAQKLRARYGTPWRMGSERGYSFGRHPLIGQAIDALCQPAEEGGKS